MKFNVRLYVMSQSLQEISQLVVLFLMYFRFIILLSVLCKVSQHWVGTVFFGRYFILKRTV